MDNDFSGVIRSCSEIYREGQEGTWILPEMIAAYTALFQSGFAHSVEVYEEDELIGGMYGIALGKIFFGESMFSRKPNGSKIALVHLCRHLQSKGFEWIDCQQDTPHLRTMGAELVGEKEFLSILRENQLYMLKNHAEFRITNNE